ncbi:hypothetical protein [Actinoplanes sp. DH11]|uniref:hypothetical protein n=1 Tax=Actinoplanes sp. DH11 TaxID=2857011 RepID=UPI001E512F8A|nr:hypothetical protein [Actinoplanes sp. DH11]
MSVLTRPAVLLAAASVAAGLLVAPGTAYATDTTAATGTTAATDPTVIEPADPAAPTDVTTELTAAQLTVALRAVEKASATAGAQGWKTVSEYRYTVAGNPAGMTATETSVADLVGGRYSDVLAANGFTSTGTFAADRKGRWIGVDSSRQHQALDMMGRSAVTHVFVADPKLNLTGHLSAEGLDPAAMATGYAGGGTRVSHADGSADLAVTADEDLDVTLHVAASGVLTGARADVDYGDGNTAGIDMTFAYGPQSVTLPAGSTTVAEGTLATGVAYLDMATAVRNAANGAATEVRKAAKKRTVKVATLRKVVRKDVAVTNRYAQVRVKVANVAGGVRVSATNPWTKKSVGWTVKAAGKKVVVKKA